MHNALQGKAHGWTDAERDLWVETNRKNAEGWEDYDFVVIHDPQPAALVETRRAAGQRWLWRCHIDLSRADRDVLRQVVPESRHR